MHVYNQNSINTQSNNSVVHAGILLQKPILGPKTRLCAVAFRLRELIVLHYVGGGEGKVPFLRGAQKL